LATRTDALAGLDLQVEAAKDVHGVGVLESDISEPTLATCVTTGVASG